MITHEEPLDRYGISELLSTAMEEFDLPGVGAAVITDNEKVMTGAYGVCRNGYSDKVNTLSKWHIGSCAKAMTATLMAILSENSLVSWDTSIGEFFRRHINSPIDKGWDEATLVQLVTHCAGVEADASADSLWQEPWLSDSLATQAQIAIAKLVLAKPPIYKPGIMYTYSNQGYVLAGLMAELVTQTPFEQLMSEELFLPLGMKNTSFGPASAENPWGHMNGIPIDPHSDTADTPPTASPAGRVHTTLDDWALFIIEHMRGENSKGRLLNSESYRMLHTPGTGAGERYAPGWIVSERAWARGKSGSGKVLTHGGTNMRSSALVWVAPELGFATLIATNTSQDSTFAALDKITGNLISKYL